MIGIEIIALSFVGERTLVGEIVLNVGRNSGNALRYPDAFCVFQESAEGTASGDPVYCGL